MTPHGISSGPRVPSQDLKTALVVVTSNGLGLLRDNVTTWRRQSHPFLAMIVVDNGSRDGTAAFLAAQDDLRVLRMAANRGFAAGANAGIRLAMEDDSVGAVALVNDDVALDPAWHAEALAALAADPRCGACATCLLQADRPEHIDTAGIDWVAPWRADNARHGDAAPAPGAVTEPVAGACAGAALLRRTLLEDVGLFDETLFAYQEDVDLALRAARRGWRCVFAPAARGLHRGHASNRPFPLGGTRADFYNARNRLLVLVKSLPAAAWRRYGWRIACSVLADGARSFAQRRAPAVLSGHACAVVRLPRTLYARVRGRPAAPGRSNA